MIFQFRPLTAGGHVTVNVYVAPSAQSTFAYCGKLTFQPHEYETWLLMLARAANNKLRQDGFTTFVEMDDALKEQQRQAVLKAARERQKGGRALGQPDLNDIDPI